MQKFVRVNERIRAPEVRVIGPNAEQLGVVILRRALELAREHESDLVEIAPTARPPVCRIMDFSKFKYDQEKKERLMKKNQKVAQLKQIRLKPFINENDYQIKLKQTIAFLAKKDKVKVNMFFRGREAAHKEIGHKVLERIVNDAGSVGQVEKPVTLEGRVMSILLSPAADKPQKIAV